MRRGGVNRSGSLAESSQGEQGFWPSYADMMSALALILFFLMLLSYIQNLITGNDLQNTQEVLEETRITLSATQAEVEDALRELAGVTDDLDTARATLDEQERAIAGYAETIAGQSEQIAAQGSLIDEQKEYISAADTELKAMRSQMQTIAVLRLSILEQIRDSIVSVMGDASKVSIGENGSIILSEGILFDLGSSDVKPTSRGVLDQLIQVFEQFLADGDNARYVDSIVISGHTDSTGGAELNRTLSTQRANSVLNYLLTGRSAALEPYAQYFCAAGYGATRPVQSNDTDAGRAANRRIEISMILKDETVLEIVEKYLELEMPEVPEAETQTGARTLPGQDAAPARAPKR